MMITHSFFDKKIAFPFVVCSLIRTVELRSKVGFASTIKIKAILFCIVFGFHYLCPQNQE